MIILFFNILIVHTILFSYGAFFLSFFFKEKISKANISEIPLFGIIILSFISLIINFFFSLNSTIGSIILIIGIAYFFRAIKLCYFPIKKIFKIIFTTSIITCLLLSYSNIYRPDAGLYHLPFISLLNENKIIIGSANIHSRFGMTSIIQYLSAIQNNIILDLKSISIPIAAIFSFSVYFFYTKMSLNIIKKEKIVENFIIFLICCFSLINFGRFSNYGNDSVSHLFYFVLIVFILNNFKNLFLDITKFHKIFLISVFLFSTKAFMLMILIVPFVFFLFHKKKREIILNKNTFIIITLLLLWLIRNVAITGCMIYPVEKSCFKSLKYYDNHQTLLEAASGEAWSKDWVNQKKNKLKFEDFNKNFNWLITWKNNHLLKILEKLSPFLVFLIILLIVFKSQSKNKKNQIPDVLNLVFITSALLSILWFLKFPLYRYGLGFIAIMIICSFVYLVFKLNLIPKYHKLQMNFKIFFLICMIVFMTKNFLRIHKNIDNNTNGLWPDIYSEENNYVINNFKGVYNNKQFLYFYSNGKLCMYSQSPCSHYNIKNLNKDTFLMNSIYWKD